MIKYKIDLLLSIENEYITKEIESFKKWSSKDHINIELSKVGMIDLEKILKLLKEDGKLSSNTYNTMKVAVDLIKNLSTAKISKLNNLPDAINTIFNNLPNHIVFMTNRDGEVYAYSAISASYCSSSLKDSPDYVNVSFKYYSKGDNSSTTATYYHSDIRSGASAIDLLADKGFILETPELMETYNAEKEIWTSLLKNHGQQYLIQSYSELDRYARLIKGTVSSPTMKVVNNFGEFGKIDSVRMLTIGGVDYDQAIHFYLPVFVLDKHINVWASTKGLEIYKYNPDIKSKLILHPDHEDLIDALADTYTIEMEDIIENKSGGTVVLATGTAGYGCSECSSSKGELKVSKVLRDNRIRFETQHNFNKHKNLKRGYSAYLRYDFYLPEYNLCVEYNGQHHYESLPHLGEECFLNTKLRDQIKNKFCLDNNIRLLHIPHWINLTDNIILQQLEENFTIKSIL